MIKRYFDLCLLALVGGVLTFFIAQFNLVNIAANQYVSLIQSLPSLVQVSVFFLAGVFAVNLLIRLNILNINRLIFSSCIYPPLSFSVWMIVFTLLFYYQLNIDYFFQRPFYFFILGIVITNIYIICVNYPKKKALKKIKSIPIKKAGIEDKKQVEIEADLLKWLSKEEPVSDSSYLMFNRTLYVERILNRLKINEASNQIALCGEYGSGKTSILNIVCNKLESESWLTLKIDSWGRDSKTLGKQILNMMLNKANEHFDISALQPLPSNYQNALKLKGGWFNFFGELTNKYESTYHEQINELDLILTALKIKILVVLEDLDRNNDMVNHCSELGVLLDKLKCTKSIRFVVAVGYNQGVGQIISRVCDYREDLANESFLDSINDFTKIWIKRATEQKCFLPQKYNNNFSFQSSINSFFNPVIKDVHIAINTLIATPRTCKQVLRRVDEIWMKDKLLGEIDLVNLIVLQIIREVAPSLFSLIIKFENSLLNGVTDVTKNQDRIDKKVKKLQGIFQECMDDYDNPVALSSCLGFLYSSWPRFNRIGSGIRTGGQSLESNSNSVRYLDRFIRESLTSDELSDQVVISLMVDYKSKALSKTKEEHSLIEKVTFNLDYLGGFLEFIPQYWLKNDGEFNHVVFKRFVIDVIREVTEQYATGFIYSAPKPLFDNESKNWNAFIDLIDTFVHVEKIRHDKWLTKIAIENLVNTDLNLLMKFLDILGCFGYFEFQQKIINMLNQSLSLGNNALMLDSQSHPRDVYKLCNLLSYQGDSHSLSNNFNIKQWEPTFEIIIDRALSDSVIREKLLVIVMMFFIKSENNDRNTPLINIDLMKTLDTSLVKKIKSVTNQSNRDKLINSFEYVIPVEIDTWVREINKQST